MQWFNEPQNWSDDGKVMRITSDAKTDFWRKTHYGFVRDNGHFYHQAVKGSFEARVKFMANYTDLYDQAGLMVRADETTWMKCGIEFVNGRQFVSAVVTRDFSDWSVVPLAQPPEALWLRVIRDEATVEVSFSLDSVDYTMIRTAQLSSAQPVDVGVMCASPEGGGFESVFEDYSVRALERQP